jgi:hypothetical protein
MSPIAFRPEREAISRVFREFDVVEEDLQELIHGLGGSAGSCDRLSAVAVTDTNGLVDIHAEIGDKRRK